MDILTRLVALARRGVLPPALRDPYRRTMRRLLAGRVFPVEIEGLKFACRPFENRDDFEMVAKGRLPEPEEREWLAGRLFPGAIYVDVGANIGTHLVWLARRAPAGVRLVAVEPSPATRLRLAETLALNQVTDVTVIDRALGATHGQAVLHPPAGNAGAASLLGEGSGYTVAVMPLADLPKLAGVPRIDVLKIDVEGFEDRVVVPFLRDAPREIWPQAVMIEIARAEDWADDAVAALRDAGYRIDRAVPENLMFVRER
ncbi:FkbM family methyltransferase [Segnochrobactraceae bacterium EtOH-i3]